MRQMQGIELPFTEVAASRMSLTCRIRRWGLDNYPMFNVGQDWISGRMINHIKTFYPTGRGIKQSHLRGVIILCCPDEIK